MYRTVDGLTRWHAVTALEVIPLAPLVAAWTPPVALTGFLSGLALRHPLAVPGRSAIAIVRGNLRDRCAKWADCARFALRAPKRGRCAARRRATITACPVWWEGGGQTRSHREFVDRSRSAQCASGGSGHRRNCHHCIKRQL